MSLSFSSRDSVSFSSPKGPKQAGSLSANCKATSSDISSQLIVQSVTSLNNVRSTRMLASYNPAVDRTCQALGGFEPEEKENRGSKFSTGNATRFVACSPLVGILMSDSPFDISTAMRWRAANGYTFKNLGDLDVLFKLLLEPSTVWNQHFAELKGYAIDKLSLELGHAESLTDSIHEGNQGHLVARELEGGSLSSSSVFKRLPSALNRDMDGNGGFNFTLLKLGQYDAEEIMLIDLERQCKELQDANDIKKGRKSQYNSNGVVETSDDYEDDVENILANVQSNRLSSRYAVHKYRRITLTDKKTYTMWRWISRNYEKIVSDFNARGQKKIALQKNLDQVQQNIRNLSVTSMGRQRSARLAQQIQQLNEDKDRYTRELSFFSDETGNSQSFSPLLSGGILSILRKMEQDPKNETNQESEFQLVSSGKRNTSADVTQSPAGTARSSVISPATREHGIISAIDTINNGGAFGSPGISPSTQDGSHPNSPSVMPSKQSVVNVLNTPIPPGMQQDFKIYTNSYRLAALELCGWVNSNGCWITEDELQVLEEGGHYEIAAGFAIFRGCDFIRAIAALQRSSNEKLKLAATALAGLSALSHGIMGWDDGKPSSGVKYWQDMCKSLSETLKDPYLSAIFALFAANGDWSAVFRISALPIRDRVAIALRFLPDEALISHVYQLAISAIAEGDLDGVILTGFSPLTVNLIQSYVDKTGDVQTAAMLGSVFVPRMFKDKRVDIWIDSYRDLLDRWGLFEERCKFDVELGSILLGNLEPACIFTPQSRDDVIATNKSVNMIWKELVFGNQHDESNVSNILKSTNRMDPLDVDGVNDGLQNLDLIGEISNSKKVNSDDTTGSNLFKSLVGGHVQQPQVLVQCMYCKHPINNMPREVDHSAGDSPRDVSLAEGTVLNRIRCCANCRKSLPRCSLCLMQLGNDFGSAWMTWCQTCHHGGHASHLEDWFATHEECPVASCSCSCASI